VAGRGIEFHLTNIRSSLEFTVEVPANSIDSVRRTAQSKQTTNTTDPIFYITLVSQELSLNASQNTSQVMLGFIAFI